ncbi:MAG: hypothetical protein R3D52_13345 [Xanthobacteraceae bacterium]
MGPASVLMAIHQDASGNTHDLCLLLRLGDRRRARRHHRDDIPRECETDLFGEQSVLCGGLVELMKAGFGCWWTPATRRKWPVQVRARGESVVDLIYEAASPP